MNAVKQSIAKARWTEKEASVVVEAWRESGLTVSEYARKVGMYRGRLVRWKARLAKQGSEAPGFHPVRLVGLLASKRPEPLALEATLRSGVKVRIPEGYADTDLESVIAALEGGRS